MEACRSWRRYKGLYPPRCNGGEGCDACVRIYADMQAWKRSASTRKTVYAPTEFGIGVMLIGLATKQLQCLERIEALLRGQSAQAHKLVEPKYDGSRFGRKAK